MLVTGCVDMLAPHCAAILSQRCLCVKWHCHCLGDDGLQPGTAENSDADHGQWPASGASMSLDYIMNTNLPHYGRHCHVYRESLSPARRWRTQTSALKPPFLWSHAAIVMILNNDKAINAVMQKINFSLNAASGLTVLQETLKIRTPCPCNKR